MPSSDSDRPARGSDQGVVWRSDISSDHGRPMLPRLQSGFSPGSNLPRRTSTATGRLDMSLSSSGPFRRDRQLGRRKGENGLRVYAWIARYQQFHARLKRCQEPDRGMPPLVPWIDLVPSIHVSRTIQPGCMTSFVRSSPPRPFTGERD